MSGYSDTTREKWKTLVDRLSYYTQEKKLNWKSSADEDTYLTKISSSLLSISEEPNPRNYDIKDYRITIFKDDGEVADSFIDDDLVDGNDHSYHVKMLNLYRNIVRIESGSEEILDRILGGLPDPDPFL